MSKTNETVIGQIQVLREQVQTLGDALKASEKNCERAKAEADQARGRLAELEKLKAQLEELRNALTEKENLINMLREDKVNLSGRIEASKGTERVR